MTRILKGVRQIQVTPGIVAHFAGGTDTEEPNAPVETSSFLRFLLSLFNSRAESAGKPSGGGEAIGASYGCWWDWPRDGADAREGGGG